MRRILQVLGALLVLAPLPAAAAHNRPATREAPGPAPTPAAAPGSRPAARDPNAPGTPGAANAPAKDPNAAPLAAPVREPVDEAPGLDAFVLYDYHHHVRPKEFNASVGGPLNNVGLAIWFTIPVVPDGLIRDVNDQFNVEVGLIAGLFREVVYWDPTGVNYLTLAVSAGLRWDFHVTQKWVPFALLKATVNFGYSKIVLPGGGAGVLYRITDDWRLRLELGYPLGVSGGLTFDLPAL